MSRIAVVTGGAGFVGGHLTERLVGDGWAVRVLDVREPELDCDVEWVDADVRDAEAMTGAARGASVVFHLATVVGVERLLSDPLDAIDITINGTRNALDAATEARAALVHLSTSEVLGVNPDLPWAEGAERYVGSALVDRWSYASSKAAAEHVVLAGAAHRNVAATVIRPFNVYGPRQEPRFVVPLMVGAALRGEPIPVHHDGRQTRCFTYVGDAVDAMVRAGDKPGLAPLLHVGTSDEVSMAELAEKVGRAVGGAFSTTSERPEERLGEGYQDIPRRVPDASLARAVLGWEPRVDLNEGLARTIEWARAAPDVAESGRGI
jgi:UDP-glucose 4-epimerase